MQQLEAYYECTIKIISLFKYLQPWLFWYLYISIYALICLFQVWLMQKYQPNSRKSSF